jgi:Ser/Thr protein kinase RdoA (MazF antagonist)
MSIISDELQARAQQALAAWGLPDQQPELLKYRENAVFKVRLGDGGKAALRLHRPGYHSEASLHSELLWMDDLRHNGLNVPQPIPALDGSLLVELHGAEPQFADLIGWVEGRQIGEGGKPLDRPADEIAAIYHRLGAAMAMMHDITDRWTPPPGFYRPAWDGAGLLGENPLWGRFWDCAGLSAGDGAFLSDLRLRLRHRLEAAAAGLDYGLIHADLVRENVLVHGEKVAMIDFDDCGYGFRLFDFATALLRGRRDPHYQSIKASLIAGYRTQRALGDDTLSHLPLFMLLRGLTYIGWVGERPDLPDAAKRMARYVADVRELAAALLAGHRI